MSTLLPTTVPTKRLAASITPSDTTFQVSDILGWDGNALTAVSFGTIAFGCFRDTNGTVLELFSWDPTTVGNGDISFINRGLNYDGDETTVIPVNEQTWVKGTTLVELGSNPPQMWQWLKAYIDGIAISGAPNASSSAKGIVQIATVAQINAATALGSTGAPLAITPDQLALSNIGLGVNPTGAVVAFSGLTVPNGWLAADGSAVSRSTQSTLFAALSKSQTCTISIASPAVVTATAHGLAVNNRVYLTTTGGLPSGLTTGVGYYIISSGFGANSFELALAPGGAAINTTGSQSGVQTITYMPHGGGDGLTTFNLPDRRNRVIVGAGTGTKVITIFSVSGNVITGNLSVANNNEFITGQSVVFAAGTAGDLTNGATYFVVRTGNNTFSLATSLVNAQATSPTLVTLAGTETGTFTLTFSTRTLGDTGGEETHAMNGNELLAHTHFVGGTGSGLNGVASAGGTSFNTILSTSAGGNASMNNMQPFGVDQFIIKT